MLSSLGLRARLLLIILLIAGLSLGLSVYRYAAIRNDRIADSKDNVRRLARVVAGEQSRLTTQTRYLLVGLANEVRARGPSACTALLGTPQRDDPTYANIGVIELDGSVSCSARPLPGPVNLSDRVYFQRAVATREFAAGEYQVGRITGQPSINFGYPVLDDSGRVQRVVFAAADLNWLNLTAAGIRLPEGSALDIFDRRGTVLAHFPNPARWVGRSAQGVEIVEIISRLPSEGSAVAAGLDGVRRLYGFAPLPGVTPGDAYLTVGIPLTALLAGPNAALAQELILLLAITAAGMILAWIGASRLILTPTRALLGAINGVRTGILTTTGLGRRIGGELGDLARAFDDMVGDLDREKTEREQAEAALGESEARYRALVDSAQELIFTLAPDGRFATLNPAFDTITGWPRDQWIGKAAAELLHPDDLAVATAQFEQAFAGRRPALFEARMQTASDRPVIVEVTATPLVERDALVGIAGVARDVTARVLAQQEVRRQLDRMDALRKIDMAIMASLDLRVTLEVILDQVTRLLGVDAAEILLLTPASQTLYFAAERGFRTQALQYTRLRVGDGHAGQAALERRTVTIANLAEQPGGFLRSPLMPEEGFVSYVAVPLLAKGEVKGVLELFHRSPLTTTRDWARFLEALAGQTAIAVDNSALFDDLQLANVELTLAYDATIEGWSKALDLRDKETEGHSQRVTDLTVRLARDLKMSEEEIVHVHRGALLHDIGKMGIPDGILLKPGALTVEEWGLMRRHPVYAHDLLSPIRYLRPALDIPYCHHEKWDGTGYPRGLRGDQIPLAARIFAVADVWDALTSDRPYRAAWPKEKALAHIRDQAGSHFDPQVVETFLRHMG